ncbi:MAG TPA: pyridoxal phosphate-dependent aminotransferase [Thermoanaerobaculia bacterium]|jgi:aspartate aminotransferase
MPRMHFSQRARSLAESATMRVSRRAKELRAAGREILDLSAGEPDFSSPAVAVEAARQALADGFTRYTVAAGIPDLREALAEHFHRRYAAPWTLPNALVTVGAKAALFQLFQVLVDSGDEVVYASPAWVSFPEQIRFAGGRPVAVATRADDGFTVHADAILAAVTGATRMILLNSPSNPTGGMIGEEDLRRVVAFAAQRGLLVLSDETYDRFVYDGRRHASAAALAGEYPETVVLVGSFSKTYAMTGWRLGYALGPAELIAKTIAVQGHATSNPTSFAMRGALAALKGAEDDVRRMIAEFERRRDVLVERLAALPGVSCRTPAGAFYAFPHVAGCFRDGRRGSVAFAEHLLETAGVALVPGLEFGADDHVRLSFACSRAEIEEATDRIATVLRS